MAIKSHLVRKRVYVDTNIQKMKTPDSIQVASAIERNTEIFITNNTIRVLKCQNN